MDLISIIIGLIIIGLILYIIETLLPIDPTIKRVIHIVVIVVVLLWLLRFLLGGVIPPLTDWVMSLETALLIMTATGMALLLVPWLIEPTNEHGLHLARLIILLVVAGLVLIYMALVGLPNARGGAA